MVYLIWTMALAAVASSLRVCVVVSPSTPAAFFPEFSALLKLQLPAAQVQRVDTSRQQVLCDEGLRPCALVLDAAADFTATATLQLLCKELRISLLSASQTHTNIVGFGLHLDPMEFIPSVMSTVRYFNQTTVSLLYGPSALGAALREYTETFRTQDLVTAEESYSSLKSTITRRVRKQGASLIVIATPAAVVPRLLAVLKEAKMMREGYAYIVVGEAVWGAGRRWQGLLAIKESDCALADTSVQCDVHRTAAIIGEVSKNANTPEENLEAEDFWSNGALRRTVEIAVVNSHNGVYAVVGRFSSVHSFIQTNAIYFPGNRTTLPQFSKSAIEISFNSGLENPSTAPTAVASTFYRGEQLAIKDVNQRADILPTHILVTNQMAFGASQWNETWATPRILANSDRLGVAYMSGYASAVTMDTLLAFDKFALSLPAISSSNSLIALGNSTVFPWFVRNGVSDLYFSALFTTIMPVMGWKRCAVLYGDDVWGTSVYTKFRELAAVHQIEILNNDTLRRVPGLGSKQLYEATCTQQLLELFRCNARFVILFVLEPAPQYILELMFDLGARKGDFIFSGSWLASSYVTNGTAANIMKREELLEGTVGFTGSAWIGATGSSVRSAFRAAFNDTDPAPFACYYYDSVFAIAHAIDTCEQLGFDYESPHRLMRFLRETRFVGCSGFVSWLSGENNRAYVDYNILNFVRNETTGVYSLNTVGRYSPTSTQLFNFSVPLKFADGTSTSPTDLRVVLSNCPFEDKYRRPFHKGRNLSIAILTITSFYTAALSVFIYKKAWAHAIPSMRRSEISLEDVLFMCSVAVEVAQLAHLGSDFRSLLPLSTRFSQVLAIDLADLVTFSRGVYWVAMDCVLATVGVWVGLSAFVLLRVEDRCQRLGPVGSVGCLAYFALPVLSSAGFVPIVSTLLDVFICEEAVGSTVEFTESILSRDCYEHCWRGAHLVYSTLASVSLVLYIPTAVLLNPVWQHCQHNLHIRTRSHFSALKPVVQVVLVCLSKTAKRRSERGFGVAFVLIVLGLFAFSWRFRAFNYARVSMWYCVGLMCVVVLDIVALINSTVSRSPYPTIVLAACWVALVSKHYSAVGLCVQRRYCHSLLFRPKGRDFSKLIKFAFTGQVRAEDVRPQLNYASRTSEVELSDIALSVGQ